MKYRKKPVVIEAFKFDGRSNTDPTVPQWFADAVVAGAIRANPDSISIKTLEGEMRGDLGDWIIRGVKGEIYPCKPEIFEATYNAEPEGEPIGVAVPGPVDVHSQEARDSSFERSLESIINQHSRENGSNTPDFILAQFLMGCVRAWDAAVMRRSQWYGGKDQIAPPDAAPAGQ